MSLSITSNNYIKELPVVNNELNTVQQNTISNVQPSLTVNSEQKPTLLNQKTIVQLQEIQDYSILQISALKDEIDFNGTPSLEWLKDRDDNLYKEKIITLSNGFKMIENFKEIVGRNISKESISYNDWKKIELSICGFENGLANNKEHRAKTNDSIIHKVLDYIMPKTQQRIDMLKQYLSTKIKEPEIELKLSNNIDIKENTDISTINDYSYEQTNSLLNFLVKNLEWYKWFLEDKKQPFISCSLQYLQLTRSITHSLTINEITQVV